jgi:transposase
MSIVQHTVSDRVSSSWSNEKKKEKILLHFTKVKTIKNLMAVHILNHRYDSNGIGSAQFKKEQLALFKKDLDVDLYSELSDWELQKLFNAVVTPHTINYIKAIFKIKTFYIQNGKHRKHGALSTFLNGLRYYPADIDNIPKKLLTNFEYYSNKFGCDRIFNLWVLYRANLDKRLKPIQYRTGSYIKQAEQNKQKIKTDLSVNKKGRRGWNSFWFKDETNKLYKNWYCLKRPSCYNPIFLPLAVNEHYHHKAYDLGKEHWITLNKRGEVNISLVYDRLDDMLDPYLAEGLDVNVKHNMIASSSGLFWELQKGWLEKHKDTLNEIEKKGYQNLTAKDQKTLNKLVNNRESIIRNKLQEILRDLKSRKITDIVVENLTLTLSGGLGKKYNKLLRLLRFGTIRTWLRQQAHKLGMRVHDLPAAYSSQACRCGHVHQNNRKTQEVFKCEKCGAAENADTHAGGNMIWLFDQWRDVLVQNGFLEINIFGEYVSTVKSRLGFYKLKEYYSESRAAPRIQGGVLLMSSISVL